MHINILEKDGVVHYLMSAKTLMAPKAISHKISRKLLHSTMILEDSIYCMNVNESIFCASDHIHLHVMEKSSLNIPLNIFYCVLHKEMMATFHIWVNGPFNIVKITLHL